MDASMKLPDIVPIPQSSYKRMRWKNGAGWTTEVAVEPTSEGAWAWRVSIAEIDADSDFSSFPGIDRTLLVLSGGGMTLEVDSGVSHTLLPLAEPLVFPGEAVIRSRLLAGPTRDFNVMTRRDLYSHTFALHRPGAHVRLVRTPRQSFLVHVLERTTNGAVSGDSFLVPSGPDALVDLGGDATTIVVGLSRRG